MSKCLLEDTNMPRIDMIIDELIDDITYAKRTLTLQNTFIDIANRQY